MFKEKYPSPVKSARFRKYWDIFIEDIASRDNFKVSHLFNLEILCDLYIEYQDLKKILKKEGRFYKSDGRYGESMKEHRCVPRMDKVLSQIKDFSKLLEITLVKNLKNKPEKEKNEWD